MKIGGTLDFSGVRYFIGHDDQKSKVLWHLISKVHRDDLLAMARGTELKYPELSLFSVQQRAPSEDYVLESFEKLKVKGTLSLYRGDNILSSVRDLLAEAMSYGFPKDTVMQNETKMVSGILIRTFIADDGKMQFRYVKKSNMFTQIYISRGNMTLDMSEERKLKIPKLDYEKVSLTENKKSIVNSISSLDFESLREILDLTWYITKEGKPLKDYRAVKNIWQLEHWVFTPLIKAIQEAKARGEKLDIGLDTETTGLIFYDLSKNNPLRDRMVAIPIAWEDHKSFVIFVDMAYFSNVDLDYTLDRLRQIIERESGHIKFRTRKVVAKSTTLGSTTTFVESDVATLDPEEYEWLDGEEIEFEREDYTVTGHNAMFDGRVFFDYGIKSWWDDDTLQMAFNLNPRFARGNNKLKTLTHRLFGHETPELSDILGKGNEGMYRYITDERVAVLYGCADTDYTRLLKKELLKATPPRMLENYRKYDVPMLNYLYESEYYGLPIDEPRFKAEGAIVEKDRKLLEKFLHQYVGSVVNYRNQISALAKKVEAGIITEEEFLANKSEVQVDKQFVSEYEFELSGDELRHAIYEILRYPKIRFTNPTKKHPNGQPAVDKIVMERLAKVMNTSPSNYMKTDLMSSDGESTLLEAKDFNKRKFPIAYFLQVYSDLTKDWTAYFNPIMTQNLEGRIFKGYFMARIETRRIANALQTMKYKHKSKVIPLSPDWYAVNFDQASAEPRIMTSFSGDQDAIKRLKNPENDYHTENASAIKKIPPHKLLKDDRKKYKVFTLGIPYGIGEEKMTMQIHKRSDDALLYQTRKDLFDWEAKNHAILDELVKYRDAGLQEAELSHELRDFLAKTTLKPYETKYGKVENARGFYRLFELEGVIGDRRLEGKVRRPSGNFPIQSFAAELFRTIMIRLKRRCIAEGIDDRVIWHVLVHDEAHMSAHKTVHPFLMYKTLYKACTITFPGHTIYYIGINIGNSWGDCKDDENEAPVKFVERIVARWDAGEFRDDDYWNFENSYVNKKGKTIHEKGPKAYIRSHMRKYFTQRISECVLELQPNIPKTKVIDMQKLLDTFDKYTVRSYISAHYAMNRPVPLAKGQDEDDYHYESRFETWMLDYFGEGYSVIDVDGNLRKVTAYSEDTLVMDFDDEDEEKAKAAEDEAKTEGIGDFWSFDEDDLEEAAFTTYAYDLIEDKNEKMLAMYDVSRSSQVKTAGELIIKHDVHRPNVEMVNGQLYLKVGRKMNLNGVKDYMSKFEDPDGVDLVLVHSLGEVRWKKVKKDVDLDELQEMVGGLVNAR